MAECAAPTDGTVRTFRQIFSSPAWGDAAPMSDAALLALLVFIFGSFVGAALTYIVVAGKNTGTAPSESVVQKRDCPTGSMQISQLHVYPIKSCAGYSVQSSKLTPRGLQHDRTYVLVDSNWRFLSQRRCPRMALVEAKIDDAQCDDSDAVLEISTESGKFRLIPNLDGERVQVTVWGDECTGIDQGDAVADFLANFLDTEGVRLVRMAKDCVRNVEDSYVTPSLYETSFSDGYPYLLVTEVSREEVSRSAGRDISMKRFRPNIVVEGEQIEPFDEDYWETALVGNTVFQMPKISSRCKIPTVNDNGEFDTDNEPTETLKKIHSIGRKVLFGQNAVCAKGIGSTIAVGDQVRILSMHVERKV